MESFLNDSESNYVLVDDNDFCRKSPFSFSCVSKHVCPLSPLFVYQSISLSPTPWFLFLLSSLLLSMCELVIFLVGILSEQAKILLYCILKYHLLRSTRALFFTRSPTARTIYLNKYPFPMLSFVQVFVCCVLVKYHWTTICYVLCFIRLQPFWFVYLLFVMFAMYKLLDTQIMQALSYRNKLFMNTNFV